MANSKVIDKLTPEQERMIDPFREECRKRALNTAPVDPNKVVKAINRLYVASKLKQPDFIFIVPSPIAALALRQKLESIDDNKVPAFIKKSKGEKTNEVEGQTLTVMENFKVAESSKITYQSTYFNGGIDEYWLSFYQFAKIIGVEYTPEIDGQLQAYQNYSETCGISYLYEKVAIVSQRYQYVKFDHQNRLHCDDGPAIQYPDGFSVYSWRGTRIPSDYIEKRFEVKAEDILKISNAENRRIATEIYAHIHGASKFIIDLKAKLISEDVNHSQPRRLYEIGDQRFIHVINGTIEEDGTRREFILGAVPNASTPHDVIAASYGRPSKKYKEAVRT